MKDVVLCVIEVSDDKYLFVSRKNNTKDFGLVGGKVEPNETIMDGLFREVFEETGLKLDCVEEKLMVSEYQGTTIHCFYTKIDGITKDYIDSFNKNRGNEGLIGIFHYTKSYDEYSGFGVYNKYIFENILNKPQSQIFMS